MKSFLFSVALALIAPAAFASGTWSSVTVSSFEACSTESCTNGLVYVQLSANSTGTTCATTRNWAVIDPTSAGNGILIAVLQSARLSGSTISLTGTGSCSLTGGTYETIATVTE